MLSFDPYLIESVIRTSVIRNRTRMNNEINK